MPIYRDTENNLKQYDYETINYTFDDVNAHEHGGMGGTDSNSFC